jgi:hypothetical protein
MRLNNFRYQNDDAENTGGGGDTPLGEKGQRALEAEKQKARELAKKLREQEELLKRFEGIDLTKAEEALKFQQEAAIREAEAKANTEEARRIEREQAAAEKKRLLADKEAAIKERQDTLNLLSETQLSTTVIMAVSSSSAKPENIEKLSEIITSVKSLKSQLAYLTKNKDGVDADGVYVVDKSGDPIVDPDDRNKFLSVKDWVDTEIRKKYTDMFRSNVATGDGLRGSRGRSKGTLDVAALGEMTPLQKLEWHRKNNPR